MASNSQFIPKVDGYIIAEKLGSGSFAEVFKAFKKNDKREVVAIKCVEKDKLSVSAQNNLVTEIKILKSLSHDNIVQLKDFLWDKHYIFIIMEYCSGGSLSHFIHKRQRLSESVCQQFLQQLALALKYLREKNISHFDLKPENILLASRTHPILKIGDFGLAQYISENDKNSMIKGSPLYMAPEIVLKREYDARADIWSTGVVLFECLFGKAPFSSKTFEELIQKIKSDKAIEIPMNSNISQNCADFLKGCLERDLVQRLDFPQFFDHPFIDLKHASCENSIKEATLYLTKAVQADKSDNSYEAFEAYNEGLKYLLPLMHSEKTASKRVTLKRRINEYVSRMKVLKAKMKLEGQSHSEIPPSITNISLSHVNETNYGASLDELEKLAKTTPQMPIAIEIALSAEQYERENNFTLALEKYEMAIKKLLSLIQNEPKGRRRELMVNEINRWMDRAERAKLLKGGIEHLKLSECTIAESETTCTVQ